MMDKVNELMDELFKGYQNGQLDFSVTREEMTSADWRETTDALRYIEDKGVIKTAKAMGFWNINFTTYGIDEMEERRKRTVGMSIYDFKNMMNKASVVRNGEVVGEFDVLYHRDIEKIDFPPDTSYIPQPGDVVTVCGKSHTITDVYEERPFGDKLYAYAASFKSPRQDNVATQVFNIGNAHQSIIGSQQNATIYNSTDTSEIRKQIANIENKEDAEALYKLVERIEELIEDNQPISKGAFSRYTDVLARYAPVATGIAGLILQWLSFK